MSAAVMFDRITFDPNGEYPDLESEDIREALSYAAALANEEVHPFASPIS